MTERCFIILTDKLEQYEPFFHLIKNKAPFQVYTEKLDKLFDDEWKNHLSTYKARNIVVGLYDRIYTNNHKKLTLFFKEIYSNTEPSIITFNTDEDILEKKNIIQGTGNSYILTQQESCWMNSSANCILYILKLFNESALSIRLLNYITDFFEGIVDSEVLKKKKLEFERLNREPEWKNRIDTLTSLYNRAAIFDILEDIEEEIAENLQQQKKTGKTDALATFSIIMIDIDTFKQVNKTYGHLTGNNVLTQLGEILQKLSADAGNGISGRFEGEKFIIILPSYTKEQAHQYAEKLTNRLSKVEFKAQDNAKFNITLSIGISEYNTNDPSAESIIRRANLALYWVKENGRNNIGTYENLHFSTSGQ